MTKTASHLSEDDKNRIRMLHAIGVPASAIAGSLMAVVRLVKPGGALLSMDMKRDLKSCTP